ncbi:MAG: CAP domain-containing protein, partial [Bacteroidetes bacterium]|nr:CAP domain-containing protein [Bacteroidota bacterium]
TVAKSHTDYMVETGRLSHENFSNRQDKLVANANAKSVGENVGYGYSTAKEVLKA